MSEIFPTPIKGRAFAATTVLNWSSNLIVSITMLDLIGERETSVIRLKAQCQLLSDFMSSQKYNNIVIRSLSCFGSKIRVILTNVYTLRIQY